MKANIQKTTKKEVAAYAEEVLKENYRHFVCRWEEQNPNYEPYTLAEWCEMESESDPDFFRWLFHDPNISDFGSNLTDEEKKIATDFFNLVS